MFNFKIHCLLNTHNSVPANQSIIRIIHTCLSGYPGKKNTKHFWICGWFLTSAGETSVLTGTARAALLQARWVLFFQPQPLGLSITDNFPPWFLIEMKSRWYHSESALSGDLSVAGMAKWALRLGGVNVIACKRGAHPTLPLSNPCQTTELKKTFKNTSYLDLKTFSAAELNWLRWKDSVTSAYMAWRQYCKIGANQWIQPCPCRSESVPLDSSWGFRWVAEAGEGSPSHCERLRKLHWWKICWSFFPSLRLKPEIISVS